MTPTLSAAPVVAGKFLAVSVADETYGIAVLKVREIIRLPKITPLPQLPEFVKGVTNLRGRVVPIIDLRTKFGLPAAITGRTCIVVVQLALAAQTIAMGLIVDGVEEVLTLSAGDVEPPPEFGLQLGLEYIVGIATVKGQVKMLLDIDRVLAADTAQLIAGHASAHIRPHQD
jgi:purine-binding chemotaxis protein CheW